MTIGETVGKDMSAFPMQSFYSELFKLVPMGKTAPIFRLEWKFSHFIKYIPRIQF